MTCRLLRRKLVMLAVLGMSSAGIWAQQAQPPAADNTKTNQRDRAKSEPTADQARILFPIATSCRKYVSRS